MFHVRQPSEVPVPSDAQPISHKLQLWGCCIVIYILWVVNIVITFLNIRSYFLGVQEHWDCGKCFYKSYMLVIFVVKCLMIPVLVVTFPLVFFRIARGIRIYVTILFLATWLEMMLAVVLSQNHEAIGDVIRMWDRDKNLKFFEEKYRCCGVLGPNDYRMSGETPPKSCYMDRSGKDEDLYKKGCSTVTVKHTAMSLSVIIYLIGQFCLVLALIIYLIILKRTKTPQLTCNCRRPLGEK